MVMDPNTLHIAIDSPIAFDTSLLSTLMPIVASVASFIFGFVVKGIWDFLKRPKMELVFGQKVQGCVTHTFDSNTGNPCATIRINPKNKGKTTARCCRAYLTNVVITNVGEPQPVTDYCDTIPLRWSCEPKDEEAFKPRDLPQGMENQYIDLIPISIGQEAFCPAVKPMPNRYLWIWKMIGTFVFTIHLYSENAKPVSCKVVFKWKGEWDGKDDKKSFEVFSYEEYIRESKQ